MECKCTLTDVTRDWSTGKFRVTFEAEDDISGQIDGMRDKTLRLTAKQWRDKRSLDSNAYYWVLLSKLAESIKISKPRAHNIMLREYGQIDHQHMQSYRIRKKLKIESWKGKCSISSQHRK